MQNRRLDWFNNVETRVHPHPGLNWLTATIAVPDVSGAIDFYTGIMEMVSISELEDQNTGQLLFARIRYRGNNFVLNRENWDFQGSAPASSGQTPPFIFYLYVDDVRMLVERIRSEAGTDIISEPEIMFWGDLKARVRDPYGYYWDLAQKVN